MPIDENMGLEERLERMGIDPAQYQKYGICRIPSGLEDRMLIQDIGFTKASRPQKRDKRNGNQRHKQKQSRNGRPCSRLRITVLC
jgi:hypothetical protein